jgi:hypothetical protein
MNYYEEFGIPPDALAAKIRQVYKTLARLLHPDAQPDEALKALAERQMMRLNGMLDTLLDPEKRRAYDESLFEASHPPSLPPAEAARGFHDMGRFQRMRLRLQAVRERAVLAAGVNCAGDWPGLMQFALRQWFWILTGLVVVGVGMWCVGAKDSPVAEVAQAGAPSASVAEKPPSATPAVRTEGTRASRGAAAPDAGDSELGRVPAELLPGTNDQQSPQGRVPLQTIEPPPVNVPAARADTASGDRQSPQNRVPLRTTDAPPVNVAAVRAGTVGEVESQRANSGGPDAGVQQTSWAGRWFYVPQLEDAVDPSLYAPSYIELVLVEEHGNLVGNYRARYKVPNQALSSEVGFRMEGKATSGNSVKVVWASDQGAKGEVELTLRSSDLLKVTWWTTLFGRGAALSSGTATLVRQRAH